MNPNEPRKFFDVAQPGSSTPSATSRPVISQASQPDPMVGGQANSPAVSSPRTAPQLPESSPPDQSYGSGVPATENSPAELDAQALLIQAGNFVPPKATASQARRIALIVMLVFLVVLCGATYWLVSTI